ncbi:MAG: hypothetical protein JO024_00070 [Candidatus Eremiobacteraeota bacterium]|nr:hypothetical protein [Candidatus Eremiobacteraeota bacterium]
MKQAVPPQYRAPQLGELPQILTLDFAVVRESDGTPAPRLIELQGFPSLIAFEVMQRDAWIEAIASIPGLDREWSSWYSGLDRSDFLKLARRVILGNHAPEQVVLMDLDPPTQKTAVDFTATKTFFDVDAICPTDVIKRGRRLYRKAGDGKREALIERIYNRVIMDEVERKNVVLPFDLRDELDVEWAPHPDWFFIWSKQSLPFLEHPAVPKTTFLSQLREIPADLTTGYVLKPLFSFAGGGVNVAPTADDLKQIPDDQRSSWCLQEKVEYAPLLLTTEDGEAKVELRMMFLRPDDAKTLQPAENLCRLSRGAMFGVDFNRELGWVGSTIGMWPAEEVV